MSRIELLSRENANGASRQLLDEVQAAFGALKGGALGAKLGEQIAVAIAGTEDRR